MRSIFTLVLVIAATLMCAAPVLGQTKKVRVVVESSFEPASAVGLLISKNGTTERLDATFEKVAENRWAVSFPFRKEELEVDTTASAILVSSDNELAFGNVQRIGKENLSSALLSLPACKNETTLGSSVAGQFALVESLIGVRSERRTVWKQVLEQELDDDTINKLSQLEVRLGLDRPVAIGREMPPLVLLERLTRIRSAIKQLKAEKARRELAAPKPAAEPAVGTEPAAEAAAVE